MSGFFDSQGWRDFASATGGALGLALDVGEKTAELALSYASAAVRVAKRCIVIALGAIAFAVLGTVLGMGWLSALAVVVGAGATICLLVIAMPFAAGVVKIAELESVSKVLRFAGILAGWAFITAIVLYGADTGPDVGKLLTALVLGGLGSTIVFGWRGSRTLLGAKMLLVAALAAMSVWLPQTSSALSGLGSLLDRTASRVLAPPPFELPLTEQTLESTEFFDRDGNPRFWCRSDPSRPAGYRCYDENRRDPVTGERLTGIGSAMLEEIRIRLSAARVVTNRRVQEIERQEAEARLQRQTAERLATERRAAEEAAAVEGRWQVFEEQSLNAPMGGWSAEARWQQFVVNQRVSISYVSKRYDEAIEIARRLNALGAEVAHSEQQAPSTAGRTEVRYPFRSLETATAIQSLAFEVAQLQLVSSGANSGSVEILLL